jgi:hypothetical protein
LSKAAVFSSIEWGAYFRVAPFERFWTEETCARIRRAVFARL